jgi:hypothetical protein
MLHAFVCVAVLLLYGNVQILGGVVIVVGLLTTTYAKARERQDYAIQVRKDIGYVLTIVMNNLRMLT